MLGVCFSPINTATLNPKLSWSCPSNWNGVPSTYQIACYVSKGPDDEWWSSACDDCWRTLNNCSDCWNFRSSIGPANFSSQTDWRNPVIEPIFDDAPFLPTRVHEIQDFRNESLRAIPPVRFITLIGEKLERMGKQVSMCRIRAANRFRSGAWSNVSFSRRSVTKDSIANGDLFLVDLSIIGPKLLYQQAYIMSNFMETKNGNVFVGVLVGDYQYQGHNLTAGELRDWILQTDPTSAIIGTRKKQ